MKIGFVGVGRMGANMARRLAESGFPVVAVFDVDGAAAQSLAQELPPGLAAVPLNPGIINTEMLQSCFGGSASGYPSPEEWAKSAVPFLLKLGPGDNGQQLTAPNA